MMSLPTSELSQIPLHVQEHTVYTSGTCLLSSNEIASFMAVTTLCFSHKESTFKREHFKS